MKLHAPIGAEILSAVDFPYPVVPIVRHHHENWNGTGYPDGLRGTEIPIGARILSVVDCFDGLTPGSAGPWSRRGRVGRREPPQDPERRPGLGSPGEALDPPLRSSVTVPLTHQGRTVGVLSCYASALQAFTDDHLMLLQLLAPSLASAVAAAGQAEPSPGCRVGPAGRRGGTRLVLLERVAS